MDASTEWLADKLDDPTKAEVFVANMVYGILRELDKSKAGVLREERETLASPKTLNLQMFEGLRKAGAFEAVQDMHDTILNSLRSS